MWNGITLIKGKWSDNTESVRTSCPTVSQPHTACLCSVNRDIADLGSTGPWATFVCLSVSVVFEVEKAMAIHSSTLAWKVPWAEEPGRLQSTGLLRVGHDWATSLSLFTFMHWRRKWQPTPVFLPGESQGLRSLVWAAVYGVAQSQTQLKGLSSAGRSREICYKISEKPASIVSKAVIHWDSYWERGGWWAKTPHYLLLLSLQRDSQKD